MTQRVQKLYDKEEGQRERQEGLAKPQQDQQTAGDGKADVEPTVMHCEPLSGVKGHAVREELQWLLWAGLHSLHSVCTDLQALTAPLVLDAIAGLSVTAELCHLEQRTLDPLMVVAGVGVGAAAAGAGAGAAGAEAAAAAAVVGSGAAAAAAGVGTGAAGAGAGAAARVGSGAAAAGVGSGAAAAGVGSGAAAAGVGTGAALAAGPGKALIDGGNLATAVDKALGEAGSMAAITLQVIGLAAANLGASFDEHGSNQRLSEASAQHARIVEGSVAGALADDLSWIKPMAYGSCLECVDGQVPREASLREGLQCVAMSLIHAAKAVLQCEELLGVKGTQLGAVCCKIVDGLDAEGGSRYISYELFDQLSMLAEECLSRMAVGFCCNNMRCRNLSGVSEVGLVVKGGGGGGGFCQRCKAACYCSRECQEEAWPLHKQWCKAVP